LIGGGRGAPGLKQLEQGYQEKLAAHAREMLEAARKLAQTAGIACDAIVEEGNDPYERIIAAADRMQCDLILMASHGRKGLEAMVVGSKTIKVLTHSKVPVLVVH
jgi:nucleotide-binding universal stress UspA family protein